MSDLGDGDHIEALLPSKEKRKQKSAEKGRDLLLKYKKKSLTTNYKNHRNV